MQNLIDFIESEWSVVSAAPATFIALSVLAFTVSHLWHRERIRKLKEQKEMRDDDLAFLKERTGTDDVRHLVERVSKIESELKELGEVDFAKQFTDEISKLDPLPLDERQ